MGCEHGGVGYEMDVVDDMVLRAEKLSSRGGRAEKVELPVFEHCGIASLKAASVRCRQV